MSEPQEVQEISENTDVSQRQVGPQGPEMDREAKISRAATPMSLNDRGLMQTKDSSEEWRLAQLMLSSKALPKQFENPAQVVMALQFLKFYGLNPIVSIRQTTIINGSLSLWGDLPLSICERSGLIESIKEFFIDKEYKEICFDNKNITAEIFAGVCQIKRKNRDLVTRTFTVMEAKLAGLWDKSVWKLYPRRMLQMRTRSLALKDTCPDLLSGMAISEYDYPDSNGQSDVAALGKPSVADELNEVFGSEQSESIGS